MNHDNLWLSIEGVLWDVKAHVTQPHEGVELIKHYLATITAETPMVEL